jgi:hypothetical protein
MEKLGMNYEKDAYYYNNHLVYYSITRSQFAQQSKKVVLPLSSEANSCALDLTQPQPRALACPLR